jgi:hypothetical protein
MYLKQTMVLGYNVAAVLSLQYLACVILFLYFYIRTLSSMCAVSNMAVFCISLMSCFASMLLRYCLNDSEVVTVGPIITCVLFYYYYFYISHALRLYCKLFVL